MVIPEIGFAEDPICPVTREDTVAKKNPKITIRTAPSRLTPSCGSSVRTMARAIDLPLSLTVGGSIALGAQPGDGLAEPGRAQLLPARGERAQDRRERAGQ